jgi:undecaprenol kinase
MAGKKMIRRFLKSLFHALSGIWVAFKSEQSFRIHTIAMVIAVAMGLYLELSLAAWGFVIFSIGFVLVAELFNTAIERLGDEAADGQQKQVIKKAKDIAAGAVLISALTALVIGILFLLIPFAQRMLDLIQGR